MLTLTDQSATDWFSGGGTWVHGTQKTLGAPVSARPKTNGLAQWEKTQLKWTLQRATWVYIPRRRLEGWHLFRITNITVSLVGWWNERFSLKRSSFYVLRFVRRIRKSPWSTTQVIVRKSLILVWFVSPCVFICMYAYVALCVVYHPVDRVSEVTNLACKGAQTVKPRGELIHFCFILCVCFLSVCFLSPYKCVCVCVLTVSPDNPSHHTT